MEPPKIIYEQLKKIDKIKDIAYERLFINYLKLDLKGPKKLIEVDSTDQESLIKNFNFGIPIPGLMYTFFHLSKDLLTIENKEGKQFKFHDVAPILFCTYSNPLQKIFGGINMNMLPINERLKFLTAFYEKYKEFFEDVEKTTQNNKIALNQKYMSLVLSGINKKMIDHFNKAQNANFNYGYRKYSVPNIRKFRMLEYEEWPYILYYEPREAFKKMNMNEIHRLYNETKE